MFHHIFQSSPIATTIANLADGRYVDVNPAAERLLGYSRDELIGRQQVEWERTLAPAARAHMRELFAAQGRIEGYPCTLTTRAGTPRDCLISIERLELDGNGYALTHIVDVSAYRQTAEAARQAHGLFTGLFHVSQIPTALTSLPEHRILDVNAAGEDLLGYTRQELLGQTTDTIPIVIDPQEYQEINAVLATEGRVRGREVRLRTKAGTEKTCLLSIETLQLEGSQYALTQLVDITARRRTEEALQASMTKLHAALDSMTDAIFIADREGRLIEFNAAFAVFHRFPSKQACPLTLDAYSMFLEFLLPSGEPASEEQGVVARALRGESATNAEYILRRTDTGETWVGSYNFAPVRDQDGAIAGAVVISRDVTTSKAAELQLRQSEARFATIFERSPVALSILHLRDVKLTDVNAACLSLLGYPREALIGHTALELGIWAHPEDRHDALQQIYAGQRVSGLETVMRTASGAELQVLFSAEVVAIHDEPHVLTQVVDITPLKEVQRELRELNRTLEERVQARTAEVQDLYDHAPTGYYSLDAEGRITRINQTLLDWLGYACDELLGHALNDIIFPASRATFAAGFTAFKERGWLRDIDGVFVRKDGSSFSVLLNATAIYDRDGTLVSSRASVFDNTRRKRAEDALRESEAQNRLLFEESPAAMALFSRQGRIARANRAFAQLVGHPVEHVQGQTLDALDLLPAPQLAQLAAEFRSPLNQEAGFAEAILPISRADGELRTVELRAFTLTLDGEPHYLAAIHDLTRERQTEAALRQANAELARAARAKDEFLANMSHELRTPINAILAYSESLQDAIYDPLTPRQHRVIDAVATAGQHLLTLISDILDLAKVEAGRLELQTRRVSVHELCQASLLFVHEQALKKGLRLSFQLNDHEASLVVDPTRLKQMLVNLLSNAVKFTPDGGAVGLSVTVDRTKGVVQFMVHDTGIGIAPEDMGRLFQPFSQLDAALNRAHEGTGLGLALVRRLAELHGGSVTVESAVGKGSRFTIALSYQDPPPGTPSSAAPLAVPPATAGSKIGGDTERGRILLAEDNEANRSALSDYLHARGYQVFSARDGYEALDRVDDVRPQLILMDIQMPRLDGLETTRRLRAQPAYATIPIIALTALAMPGDKERCLAAGATLYLTKPVSLSGLVETIQQLLAP